MSLAFFSKRSPSLVSFELLRTDANPDLGGPKASENCEALFEKRKLEIQPQN